MKSQNSNKVFVLVAVKGTYHKPIKTGVVKFIQSLRKDLKKSGNWKGWLLQVRTEDGYKAVPILTPKIKSNN